MTDKTIFGAWWQLVRKSVSLGSLRGADSQPAEPVVQEEEPVVQLEAARQLFKRNHNGRRGLDSWWDHPISAAEAAAQAKQMEESAAFLRQRVQTYIKSEGREDLGGFVDQHVSPFARPRNISGF